MRKELIILGAIIILILIGVGIYFYTQGTKERQIRHLEEIRRELCPSKSSLIVLGGEETIFVQKVKRDGYSLDQFKVLYGKLSEGDLIIGPDINVTYSNGKWDKNLIFEKDKYYSFKLKNTVLFCIRDS